jgi:hypothetical protein
MREGYFGAAAAGSQHRVGNQRPALRGVESDDPAGDSRARAGGLAGEAVGGLLAEAGQAHDHDGRERDDDDCDRGDDADDDP